MKITLSVENHNTLETLQGFLKKLLEAGIFDLLLVPMRTNNGMIAPTLVSDPKYLVQADPLAPVLSNNSATLVGKLSHTQPRPKLGAVLRACEIRALVELVKMKQASLDDLTLIALDCAGTYNVPTFLSKESTMIDHTAQLWEQLFQQVIDHPDSHNPELRAACQICEQPVYDLAQINIQLLNSDLHSEIVIDMSEELASKFDFPIKAEDNRQAILENLISARQAYRDDQFAEIRTHLEDEEGITGVFASCIRCHNCMNVCPICYCKTCVFKSAVFDHAPMQYVEWTHQKGAYRLPSDTTLFHLTRMNHMALSCVGCGMCTEACPSELPVGLVFRAMGDRLQQVFEYIPGRDVEEPLPLITFKADEWTEVGREK
jgi:formate dehydrogenase (coenzyme F420) beta subunit